MTALDSDTQAKAGCITERVGGDEQVECAFTCYHANQWITNSGYLSRSVQKREAAFIAPLALQGQAWTDRYRKKRFAMYARQEGNRKDQP